MVDPLINNKTKLNLGCGNDFILEYRNIDINPTSPHVERADITNLNLINIVDNSINEIRAVDCLQIIPLGLIPATIQNWVQKLEAHGELIIQAHDAQVLSNSIAYEQINLQEANQLIFGPNERRHSSFVSIGMIESLLLQNGCEILDKSIAGMIFHIRARKI